MPNAKNKSSEFQTNTPRLLSGKRVAMTVLPGYNSCCGYGCHGKAEYEGAKYLIFGAECGADCVCDAVAIPIESGLLHTINQLIDVGVFPCLADDE